jgi:hypothetical protein
LPGSGYADFHILDREFASKVGILRRRPVQRRFLAPQNVHVLLSVRLLFARELWRLGRFAPNVFLLDKTETTDKVRLNCPNFNKSPGADAMKNVYEVLRQKELELSRLEKEVEALRVAAPLLSEDKEAGNDNKPTLAATASQTPIRIPQPAVNTAPQAARAAGWEDTAKRWP